MNAFTSRFRGTLTADAVMLRRLSAAKVMFGHRAGERLEPFDLTGDCQAPLAPRSCYAAGAFFASSASCGAGGGD